MKNKNTSIMKMAVKNLTDFLFCSFFGALVVLSFSLFLKDAALIIVTAIFNFLLIFAFNFNSIYTDGNHDGGKLEYSGEKADIFKGVKSFFIVFIIEAVGAFFFITGILLGNPVIKAVFEILNIPFLFLLRHFDSNLSASIICIAVIFLFYGFVGFISYYLGVKQIDFINKLIYKKK